MIREEPIDRRTGLVIAAASAAVTLAVAVTVGALLGYVHLFPASSAAPEAAPVPQTVLVPVHPHQALPHIPPGVNRRAPDSRPPGGTARPPAVEARARGTRTPPPAAGAPR